MTVYFATDPEFSLDVIRVMGVSVKETENPIGFFGTGLKYAIAVLLRTGHQITLKTGDEIVYFSTREKVIRGETFWQVYMNDEGLPFTTELGKTWEVWQAYRELHSNTLDEGGYITHEACNENTVFAVTGQGIEHAFQIRDSLFLSTKPITKNTAIAVHPGRSPYVYYRGVRAGMLPEKKQTKFTYNVLVGTELTEDRLFKSMWSVEYLLERNIPKLESPEVIESILKPDNTVWENTLNFAYCPEPSETFLDVAQRRQTDTNINPSAKVVLNTHRQEVLEFPAIQTNTSEEAVITEALTLLRKLDCDLNRVDFTITESLGPGVMGIYQRSSDRIYLTKQAIDNGVNFLAITLYEEWLHQKHNFEDESRELQQFLFDRIIGLITQGTKT